MPCFDDDDDDDDDDGDDDDDNYGGVDIIMRAKSLMTTTMIRKFIEFNAHISGSIEEF